MHYQHKIQRIYSRPRIDLNSKNIRIGQNRGFRKIPKLNKNAIKLKKVSPILLVFFIAFCTLVSIWNFINPIFESLCEDKAKGVATRITNEETTKIMNKYNYDTFFTVEKDANEKVRMITANVLKINQVTSDVALEIQKSLEDNEKNKIYISSGAITGIRFLSGAGPKIPLRIASSGTIDTDLRSEFVAQGVNQTIHRVYLDIKTNVSILTSFETIEKTIENQVLILENVIVGEIPSTYYNFEGTNSEDEALRLIE